MIPSAKFAAVEKEGGIMIVGESDLNNDVIQDWQVIAFVPITGGNTRSKAKHKAHILKDALEEYAEKHGFAEGFFLLG